MPIVVTFSLLAASLIVWTAMAEDATLQFRAPVQLKAGEGMMGQGILFPSPKMQDLDGDGVAEMLVGDLRGQLLVSKRQGGGDSTQWSALESLKTADGEPIKFDNW
ncbi:MAG TPA: hypothetical protein PLY87_16815 [Planctomycetaceae bacterium]|nr:hypothetical protein [Planctomycetaceae bacterium]